MLAGHAAGGKLPPPKGPNRIIVNNDGHGGFYGGQWKDAESLRKIPAHLRGSHVWIYQWGVMLGTKVNYPSKVVELCGEGASPKVLNQVRRGDKELTELLQRLRAEGVDTLQCVVQGCHEAGILCYVTIRANPCYPLKYAGWPDESIARFYNARFWWEHPEYRIVSRSGAQSVSLSYAFSSVREIKLAIVREVLQRDVDGVDIDFLRHPPVLGYEEPLVKGFVAEYGVDPKKLPEQDERWLTFRCRVMTEFLRKVRGAVDAAAKQKGRDLGVSVRIDHRRYRQWGLDIQTWMRDGLIDILVVGEHGLGGYVFDLAPFVKMAQGTGCLVYVSEEAITKGRDPTPQDETDRKAGKPIRATGGSLSLDDFCRRARAWYAQGATGVHVFNQTGGQVFHVLGDPAAFPKTEHK